ncbi:M56 family metallopeptidase [Longibacter salinarum]|nr:M56 family metallopeptidase [Longibacter salinarum]
MESIISDSPVMLDAFSLWSVWSKAASPLGDLLILAVWQGAVVAATAVLLLALLRHVRPIWRYSVAVSALVLMLLLPVVSSGLQTAPPVPPGPSANAPPAPAPPTAVPPAPSPPDNPAPFEVGADQASPTPGESIAPWDVMQSAGAVVGAFVPPEMLAQWESAIDRTAPVWVALWLAGVSLLALRVTGGIWWIRRLRASARSLPYDMQSVAVQAAQRAGFDEAIAVRRSKRIEVPLVCGWYRPMIVLPESLMATCDREELEALLVHELSHVHRHDVMVGWLQAAAETLLFFHPGVWWLSKQVRREREHVTDDRVVESGIEPLTYAQALTHVAEQALLQRPAPGVALTPAASDGALLHRIRRMVTQGQTEPVRRSSLLCAAATLLLVPLLLVACSSQKPSTETTTEEVITSTVVIPHGEVDTMRSGTVVVDSVIVRDSDREEARRFIIRKDTSWVAQVDSIARAAARIDTAALRAQVKAFDLDMDRLRTVIRMSIEEVNTDSLIERSLRSLEGLDTLQLPRLMQLDSLSGPRIFRFQRMGDSLRALGMEQDVEVLREHAEHLRREAKRMEQRAEQMAREAEEAQRRRQEEQRELEREREQQKNDSNSRK